MTSNLNLLPKGFVKLDDDGTIIETGTLEQESDCTEFYDGVIIPGFINSHCHIELSHLEGVFSQESGMAGFIKQIRVQRESAPKERRAEAIKAQMDKMHKEGVSAVADISNCDESFGVKASSPVYTRSFLEVFGSESGDATNIMKGLEELLSTALSCGIDASPSPHSCYTMSRELLRRSSIAALDSGYISYHNQESWEEEELIRRGKGPLADDYKSRGMSTPEINPEGPMSYFIDVIRGKGENRIPGEKIEGNALFVHNTFTDKNSIELATKTFSNPFWALCPLSNIFIHKALPPVEMLRREKAAITLGTDSLSSNRVLSMIEEMKIIQRYFPSVPLNEIIGWATINGAKFLGKESELGSIETGKRPGIVLLENLEIENFRLLPESTSRRLA